MVSKPDCSARPATCRARSSDAPRFEPYATRSVTPTTFTATAAACGSGTARASMSNRSYGWRERTRTMKFSGLRVSVSSTLIW